MKAAQNKDEASVNNTTRGVNKNDVMDSSQSSFRVRP